MPTTRNIFWSIDSPSRKTCLPFGTECKRPEVRLYWRVSHPNDTMCRPTQTANQLLVVALLPILQGTVLHLFLQSSLHCKSPYVQTPSRKHAMLIASQRTYWINTSSEQRNNNASTERKRKKLTPVPCTRMNASPWAQYWSCYPWCSMGRYVPVHLLLGGKDLGIQQGTSVWVSSPKSFNGLPITCHSWNPYSQFWNHLRTSRSGLTWVKKRNWCALLVAKPSCTHTLVPWRQGFRHPTRNELMG